MGKCSKHWTRQAWPVLNHFSLNRRLLPKKWNFGLQLRRKGKKESLKRHGKEEETDAVVGIVLKCPPKLNVAVVRNWTSSMTSLMFQVCWRFSFSCTTLYLIVFISSQSINCHFPDLTKGVDCITVYHKFEVVCLDRDVLQTALVTIHNARLNPIPDPIKNR